ncbi:MAG: porin [Rhodospirillales bacterium]
MKKILFGTTALVAAGLVTSAHAADKISLSLGGYMNQEIGIADNVAGETNVNLVSNAEVSFGGKTTLDNGITIAVDVQLEANSQGADQIDESYLTISGGFGQVKLGTENGVGDLITTHAPGVGPVGIDGSNATFWVNTASSNNAPQSIDASGSGDNEKITYISPKLFDMVQGGVSYTPSTNAEDGKGVSTTTATHDVYEATLLLDTSVSGVGVRASTSYLHGSNSGVGGPTEQISAGLSLKFAGFTVGGGYGRNLRKAEAAAAANGDGWAYNVGVAYATGPYGVSLGYHYGEAEGNTGDNGSNESVLVSELGFSYNVSSGVDFKSGIAYVQFNEDTANSVFNGAAFEAETDGWVWVNGIYLSF